MVQYVITPWCHAQELVQIRHQFYVHFNKLCPETPPCGPAAVEEQDDHDDNLRQVNVKRAVARVHIWMSRGNCPHLVESTAILNSALLHDRRGGFESYCLRAVYANAFSRFVTGLLDCHQDKRYKLSMYDIAKNIGLPSTFVELRHQATHEELPSLTRLRTATFEALEWIWNYYWVNIPTTTATVATTTTDIQYAPVVPYEMKDNDDCETWLRKSLLRLKASQSRNIGPIDQDLSHQSILNQAREINPQWSNDRILAALFHIQNLASNDVAMLLLVTQLQAKLLETNSDTPTTTITTICKSKNNINSNSNPQSTKTNLPSMSNNFHDIKAELHMMESHLCSTNRIGVQKKEKEETEETNIPLPEASPEEKGWALWKGPWVPKPIGIV
ncbi:putative cell morphogenesis protein las1-like protein [Golovinomyces cichoracearum]|uniref:Putative cell morphogenesis protein las1-like protein n=1 Tax=Golovinomyces cichoracearum TaxID=62708 RepID=A0A420J3H1_9PEZI|nr:putative cell morphogenesis protein las1-like protein [Golovinomyces cichoracearum]